MDNPINAEELDEFGFPLSGYITEELDKFGFPLSGYITEELDEFDGSLHEEYIKPAVDKIKDVSGYKELVDKKEVEAKPEELDEFGFPIAGYDTPIPKDIELPPEDVAELSTKSAEYYNQYLEDTAEGITNPLTGETYQIKKPLTEAEEEKEARRKAERLKNLEEKDKYTAGERLFSAGESGFKDVTDLPKGFELGIADFKTEKGLEGEINQEKVGKLVAIRQFSNRLEALTDNGAKRLTSRDIQAEFERSGLITAGTRVPEWVIGVIAQSGPRMAIPIIATYLGTIGSVPVAGPYAPLVGLASGLTTYGVMTFADFMLTQADYATKVEDINSGRALQYAIPSTLVGYFADRTVFGVGKWGKQKFTDAIKKVSQEVEKNGIESALKRYGKKSVEGFVVGGFAEGGAEVFETWAELSQAGVDMSTEEAQDMLWQAGIEGFAAGASINTIVNAKLEYNQAKEKIAKIQDDINKPEEKDSKEIKKERWDKLIASGDTQALNQAIDDLDSTAPKVITPEILKKLKINVRSLLYKNLLGQKTTTKSGKIRIKEALDNAGDTKIDETAANALLKLIDEPALQEKPPSSLNLLNKNPKELTILQLERALKFLSQSPELTSPIPPELKLLDELQWVTVQEILEELVMEQSVSTIH